MRARVATEKARDDRLWGTGWGGLLAGVIVTAGLVCCGAGCSKGNKLGTSITPRDLTNARPEFVFVLPTGATNLYLEHTSPDPRLFRTLYKLSVPASSLTNF